MGHDLALLRHQRKVRDLVSALGFLALVCNSEMTIRENDPVTGWDWELNELIHIRGSAWATHIDY